MPDALLITEMPPTPTRGEDPVAFNDKADASWAALPRFRTEVNALSVDLTTKHATVVTNTALVLTKADEAAVSAAAAQAAAPAYNAGSAYAFPQIMAFTDGQTYRAVAAAAAGESPTTAPAKWEKLSHNGTPDDLSVTHAKMSAGAPNWDIAGNLILAGDEADTVGLYGNANSGLKFNRYDSTWEVWISGQRIAVFTSAGHLLLHEGKRTPAHYPAGAALPTADIGIIWHDDYNSWMTWQVFNANGANYTGYASVGIGQLMRFSQPVVEPGYVKVSTANLNKLGAYAALWHSRLHRGMVVPLGSWAPGMNAYADNGDGTFRVPDLRAEYGRIFDDGRGVDAGRTFTSWKDGQMPYHRHSAYTNGEGGAGGVTGSFRDSYNSVGGATSYTNYEGGSTNNSEVRVRGFNELGAIKI